MHSWYSYWVTEAPGRIPGHSNSHDMMIDHRMTFIINFAMRDQRWMRYLRPSSESVLGAMNPIPLLGAALNPIFSGAAPSHIPLLDGCLHMPLGLREASSSVIWP